MPALITLFREIEQTDHTGEETDEDALREQLTWSGQDPALNTRVATVPGSAFLVGYSIVQKTLHDDNADLHIVVHPAWRRHGIGSQLFIRLLKRAQDLEARAVRSYVNVQNKGASLFVHKHGFEPVSTYTRLSVSGMPLFPPPILPQGFTIQSYDQIQRVNLYTEALNRSYEGIWGHLQSTQEEVAQWLPQLNSAGIFLLFAPDGTLAGTCRADFSKHLTKAQGALTALIDAPGIVPGYRDAHLSLPLLLTVIHWLLPQHPGVLELESWGDTPETLQRYCSLGFRVVKEEISYRLILENEETSNI
jgi:GNAT superfamily N-acetyltransferase